MRKYFGIALVMLLVTSVISLTSIYATVESYPDVTLYQWQSGSLSDVWDLTEGDLTLSYTLDMSNLVTPGWTLIEVGLREVGAPNLDPNLMGGWLQSVFKSSASNDDLAEMNDYHVLMKHGWSYEQYDATGPETLITPISTWSYVNYAFYFDRDGVDEWQEAFWNYKDGATYNTGGVYDVAITYHAIDDASGTMFVTINGEDQGFYTGGYDSQNPPGLMPVGRTFTADMEHLQVFYGRGGGGGYVTISNIAVDGELYVPTIDEAIDYINANVDHNGTVNSLVSQLEAAKKQLLRGNEEAAYNVLSAFINHINAQYGKKIGEAVADNLMLWADTWIGDAESAL